MWTWRRCRRSSGDLLHSFMLKSASPACPRRPARARSSRTANSRVPPSSEAKLGLAKLVGACSKSAPHRSCGFPPTTFASLRLRVPPVGTAGTRPDLSREPPCSPSSGRRRSARRPTDRAARPQILADGARPMLDPLLPSPPALDFLPLGQRVAPVTVECDILVHARLPSYRSSRHYTVAAGAALSYLHPTAPARNGAPARVIRRLGRCTPSPRRRGRP